ncbi:MAG: SDR family oxidoreductase, partial [Actinomycetota bacterium]|nr:SDR family oxidoreductase [Actinomycetota bacterium]
AGRDVARLRAVGLADAPIVQADIRDPQCGARIAEAAVESFGRLDGLVNAAGIVAFGSLAEHDDDTIEELFLTNAMGPLWLVRGVLPLLEASKGFVLQLSAVVAERPMPGMAVYAATKAAMTAADEALARELRRAGVRVIDARPPHTETGLASRPFLGTAPALPEGLAPGVVAARIVRAIEAGETSVASTAFADDS